LMDVKVEALTGTAHGEHSPDRVNHRNAHRDRLGDACRLNRSLSRGPTLQQ
jgi:hypothetical protein